MTRPAVVSQTNKALNRRTGAAEVGGLCSAGFSVSGLSFKDPGSDEAGFFPSPTSSPILGTGA